MKACKDIIINLDAMNSPSLKPQLTLKKTILYENSSDDEALKSKKKVSQMPLTEQIYFQESRYEKQEMLKIKKQLNRIV